MRPVNKGVSPYKSIQQYGEALPYLEDRIGLYCSYCEMPISHVPEVEHIHSKTKGGNLTAWDNLLLGCKYCNTRKSKHTDSENVEDYLWPDRYNTAIAYDYEYGVPTVNEATLLSVDSERVALIKAHNLFDLVKLGNRPTPKEKDRRFRERNKAFDVALEELERYRRMKRMYPDVLGDILEQLTRLARLCGFFSVWMTVFKEEPEVLKVLISSFPGTAKKFYDDDGVPMTVIDREEVLCSV